MAQTHTFSFLIFRQGGLTFWAKKDLLILKESIVMALHVKTADRMPRGYKTALCVETSITRVMMYLNDTNLFHVYKLMPGPHFQI